MLACRLPAITPSCAAPPCHPPSAGRVITGMQKARCAALYCPLFPDVVAIVRACLQQHALLPPEA